MRATDIAGIIFLILLVFSFWRMQRDPTNNFNLFDMVMDGGRLSRLACVFIGAFAVCSWVIVRLAIDGKMTEGYMTSYGAIFVAPIIAKLFSPPPVPGTTTTTTTAQQTIEKTEPKP